MLPQLFSSRVVRFGVYEVDLRTKELRKNGVLLRLQGQPFQILAVLLERSGEMVTREELRQTLWPADTFVDFDNSVNGAINRLREVLGDSAENPRFIQTLPRRGYRFIAPVESTPSNVTSPVAETVLPVQERDAPGARPRRPLAKGLLLAAGISLGSVLLFVGLYQWKFTVRHQPISTPIRSIAVIPLTNLTGDPSQEFFSDGMTDALITNLAQIHALRVISRTSTMRYKGTHKPLQQIGRELNVDAVVEGTVFLSGERVRINVQLLETSSDRHLWARSYERNLEDVLALQDEVAESIAREIQVKVTAQENALLTTSQPVNKDAYLDYLQGRALWSKRTEVATQKSIEYFESALLKEPQFAPALSGISDAYSLLGFYGAMPPQDAYTRAEIAANSALRIDSNLAEAHVSLGDVSLWSDWNWAAAEAEFKEGIELNPNYETGYRKYSNLLAARRRNDEALALARRALELDPRSPTMATHLAWMLFLSGQPDAAIEQLRNTIDLDPYYARAHRDLAIVLAHQGNVAESLRESRRAIELSEASPLTLEALGYAYARAGQKGQLDGVLRQLDQQRAHRYVSPFYQAVLYAASGRKDRAFDWLERAYRERSPQLAWLQVYPPLDELRSDPRFGELVQRVERSGREQ